MAEADVTADGEDLEEGTKKKSPLKLIIIAVVVLLIGGGAGAYFMLGAKGGDDAATETAATDEQAEATEDDETEALGEAYYFSLDPPFIVNFSGKSRARFLQVSIEGLTRDARVKEDITKHIPQVRNNLVLLLSSKTFEELNSQEGKKALRKQVLKEIQKILEAETGKEGVEDVYFTSFVMQ